MNKLLTSGKRICAILLGLSLCIPFATVAFATNEIVDSDEEIAEVLERINSEYGTQICVIPDENFAYTDFEGESLDMSDTYQNVDLEKTLRYICEMKIPQIDRMTQEATAVMSMLSNDKNPDEESCLMETRGTVVAQKNIEYATAYVEAYVSQDSQGNAIWGRIVDKRCLPHTNEKTLFVCDSPTVTHKDGNRTLYWVGDGDYYSFINGKRYYLRSGTQSTSMSISSYT